jgi:hypothetical protein
MHAVILYSANDLAGMLLSGCESSFWNRFARNHISAAIENLAEWKFYNSTSAEIDIDAVMCELREMIGSWQSKESIVRTLDTKQNASFVCEWSLPEFKFGGTGFLLKEMVLGS